MREKQKDPNHRRVGTPRWIMYWLATIDAHLGAGRATIRTGAVVAGRHPHRLGHPDHVAGARGAGGAERPRIQWFLTYQEYEAWKDTLPVVDQLNADTYAHVGHMPWEDRPNACVACQLRQKMLEFLP